MSDSGWYSGSVAELHRLVAQELGSKGGVRCIESWHERVRAWSVLWASTQEARYLRAASKELGDAPSVDDALPLLWHVYRHASLYLAGDARADVLSTLEEGYRRRLVDGLTESLQPDALKFERGGVYSVVIVAPQLLGAAHGPTANALEYAHAASLHGYRVTLVDAELLPLSRWRDWFAPFVANRIPGDLEDLTYEGRRHALWRPSRREALPRLDQTMERIKAAQPTLVLSLHAFNIVGDLFATASDVPVIHVPMTRMAGGTVSPRRMPLEGPVARHVEPPPSLPAWPAPPEPFRVALVGNRLEDEADERFAADLRRLIASDPRIRLEVYGREPRIVARWPELGGVVTEHGAVDLPERFADVHAYLNPPRLGGGTSAYLAQRWGVPVLTGGGGDVSLYVDPVADPIGTLCDIVQSEPAWSALRDRQAKAARPELRDAWGVVEALL